MTVNVLPRSERIPVLDVEPGIPFEQPAQRLIAYRKEPWSNVKKTIGEQWERQQSVQINSPINIDMSQKIAYVPTPSAINKFENKKQTNTVGAYPSREISVITDWQFSDPNIQVKRKNMVVLAVSEEDESDWETVATTTTCV